MRAFLQRPLAVGVLGIVAALSSPTFAQSDAAPAGASGSTTEPEEITVRGRKSLSEYRLELEEARQAVVDAYNAANSTNDNDITCRNERPTGSRMPQKVCRSAAQTEAEAAASRDFLRALTHSAGNFRDPSGNATFGAQVNASVGAANAQTGEAILSAESRAVIEAELERLKKENRQVYRAVVKYLELQDEYDRARGVAAAQ